ncbi:MAG: hypothetical protein K8F34_14810 [Candidatus Kuenenia stuttgartiensis]|uniref:Uncharacterized protein n=1 Tax=Kuenenia stuttgartiensis TaxID=174633 RepID=Q1Q3L7_KUEST|nr:MULTISPECIES: hypothetical protein [Kuenenia]MBZ0192945.1 hypothetical protein [Candidatus Kuenenia stuttgartiensis]MCL4727932.1 hypothetical protein [Candidatus Kuenenia stuttgartiensis]MCZ7623163.1 hypothetical protein [Candidatus Kuenenia sp.]CAJ74603.1 unknown protein [Candidatus Kuenenia stuttgartiensis]SOH05969.1 hypothetical protein KSMBR1_3495 [Candidatus Kuenenia stuttgartiensis]
MTVYEVASEKTLAITSGETLAITKRRPSQLQAETLAITSGDPRNYKLRDPRNYKLRDPCNDKAYTLATTSGCPCNDKHVILV